MILPLAFSVSEVVVAVVGLAFQHGGLADAALAALAVVHGIAAFLFHDVDDGLVGGNGQHAAGLAQLDLEGLVARLRRGRGEQLEMHVGVGPVAGLGRR